MTQQKNDLNYAEVDRPQMREREMNLPAEDRGRPQDDAENAELPGEIQQTPQPTVDPPDGDQVQL